MEFVCSCVPCHGFFYFTYSLLLKATGHFFQDVTFPENPCLFLNMFVNSCTNNYYYGNFLLNVNTFF